MRARVFLRKSAGLMITRPINVVSLNPATTSMFVSLSKILQDASVTRVHLVPVGCGEYYNLSANRACAWSVANRHR